MKRNSLLKITVVVLCLIFTSIFCFCQDNNYKYSLWKTKSFFRGFNIIVTQNLTQKDFDDLKLLGATIAHLNIYGFLDTVAPYSYIQKHIDDIERLIGFCRNANLYYTFTVRQGPGRRDVYWEGEKVVSKSTIWNNKEEQQLYAGMIKEIVEHYKNDSLFVGISPILEPNPLFDTLYFTPEMLKQMLIDKGIDVSGLYKIIIDSIRQIDEQIPILVQNVAYSCPEFFKIMEPIDDNYIVYEFHNYRPSEYVNETTPNKRTYPGKYISINNLSIEFYDSSFFENNIFKYIKEFANRTQAPIFLGEFGLLTEQIGGIQFINDISNICLQNGWHFAYWIWRSGGGWDFEKMDVGYIEKIKEIFAKWTNIINPSGKKFDFTLNPTIIFDQYSTIQITGQPSSIALIYNINGEILAKIPFDDNTFILYNTQNLPSGLYFVVILSDKFAFTSYFYKI